MGQGPIHKTMKRSLALAFAAIAFSFAGCGGEKTVASTPTPAPSYRPGEAPAYQGGGILGPAGKARNTVDQLDQQQQQREQDSGGGALTPPQP